MLIFICGFSGAGKSKLLEHLEKDNHFDYTFYDLDDYIFGTYSKSESSLGDFIRNIGIDEFRRLEIESIKYFLTRKNIVVSLGGGAFNKNTIHLFKENSNAITIWLNTSLNICLNRILGDENRPLALKGRDFLEELYKKRLGDYSKCDRSYFPEEIFKLSFEEFLSSLIPDK